jgi:hypothetical protein
MEYGFWSLVQELRGVLELVSRILTLGSRRITESESRQ